MLSKEVVTDSILTINNSFPECTNQFLEPFKDRMDVDLHKGMELNFEISNRTSFRKISPILKLANPGDAHDITELYRELYKGTYPYKEMEDVEEVSSMIQNPNYRWILFKNLYDKTLGCFTFALDFKNKKGYARGLMVKRKYQGITDVLKASLGSYVGMYSMFQDKILIWYSENRTAHTASQYSQALGGAKPIAFYPNKDVFLGKIESDIMHIGYDTQVLQKYRKKEQPKLIAETVNPYLYATKRYNLGPIQIVKPDLHLDLRKICSLKNQVSRKIEKDKYGYVQIKLTIQETGSYFKFLYTPLVQNFEKTKYKVCSLEELFILTRNFKKCMKEFKIRYSEVFVSAYEPEHQRMFLDIGLMPRGYVPSWKYNYKTKVFEDNILFNYYQGKVDKNLKLIEEGKELLNYIQLN